MKAIERIVGGVILLVVGLGSLATILPRLLPSLIAVGVLAIVARLAWYFTRPW